MLHRSGACLYGPVRTQPITPIPVAVPIDGIGQRWEIRASLNRREKDHRHTGNRMAGIVRLAAASRYPFPTKLQISRATRSNAGHEKEEVHVASQDAEVCNPPLRIAPNCIIVRLQSVDPNARAQCFLQFGRGCMVAF